MPEGSTALEISGDIRELTATEANSLFTALRKAANHPLLLRVHFQDPVMLQDIISHSHRNGYFGIQCTPEMVKAEVEDMSDFEINRLCLEYPHRLGQYQLDGDVLYESAKMTKLKEILPNLIVSCYI